MNSLQSNTQPLLAQPVPDGGEEFEHKEVQDEVQDLSAAEMPAGMNLNPHPEMVVNTGLDEESVQGLCPRCSRF